jgi:Cdc6-like AAA superfamily ATPase
VLDELDAFARRPKQALLYTLLDALHRSDMQARRPAPAGPHAPHALHRAFTRHKTASALRTSVLQCAACSKGRLRSRRRFGVRSLTRVRAAAQSAVVCISVCSDVMHMMEKRVLSRFSFRKVRPSSGLGQGRALSCG